MFKSNTGWLLASVVMATVVYSISAQKRICYVSNWAQYRPSPGTFFPNQIDASLCTHLVYAFAIIDNNGQLSTFEWDDETLYTQTMNLKNANPSLKVLLAVGGWNFGTEKMTSMLETTQNQTVFINSAVTFLRARGFDGLDLDFEYPGNRGSPPEDKQRFSTFVAALRAAFNADATQRGTTALLLTAAVAAGNGTIQSAYEIGVLTPYVDWFNLMSYDLDGAWDTQTGFNSGLFPRSDEIGTVRETLNVAWAVNYWLSQGVPKNKLYVGLTTYGRCFTLQSANVNGLGAPVDPVTPQCNAGTYTREAGFLSYYEICGWLSNPQSTYVYSAEQQAPYVYIGNQWVGYDDVTSLNAKVNWLKTNGFDGYMVWNVDLDDFSGTFCNQGPFPLLHAMLNAWNGGVTASPTTTAAGGSTAIPTTTTAGSSGNVCKGKANGLYADPVNCSNYYNCWNGSGVSQACSPTLYFNDVTSNCDYLSNLSAARRSACGL